MSSLIPSRLRTKRKKTRLSGKYDTIFPILLRLFSIVLWFFNAIAFLINGLFRFETTSNLLGKGLWYSKWKTAAERETKEPLCFCSHPSNRNVVAKARICISHFVSNLTVCGGILPLDVFIWFAVRRLYVPDDVLKFNNRNGAFVSYSTENRNKYIFFWSFLPFLIETIEPGEHGGNVASVNAKWQSATVSLTNKNANGCFGIEKKMYPELNSICDEIGDKTHRS